MSSERSPRRNRIGVEFVVTAVLCTVVFALFAALVSTGAVPPPFH